MVADELSEACLSGARITRYLCICIKKEKEKI